MKTIIIIKSFVIKINDEPLNLRLSKNTGVKIEQLKLFKLKLNKFQSAMIKIIV